MPRPVALGRPGSHVIDPHLWRAIRAVMSLGLVDEGEVTRDTGEWIIDPDTLISVPAPPLVLYEGPGNCQPMIGLNERMVQTGGETRTVNRYVCSIRWTATEILIGDIYTVTASADPMLDGRSLVIRDVIGDTFQSRRVLICEDDAGLTTGGS